MRKSLAVLLSFAMLGAATAAASAAELVEVYKSPNCGCCEGWTKHLRQAGFEVRTHDVEDVAVSRKRLGMPERYAECHTAKVGNYVVEGHVPAADIKRLLKEKPKAIGLLVPDMPQGSPGMESATPVRYNTLLVKNDGGTTVFAQH